VRVHPLLWFTGYWHNSLAEAPRFGLEDQRIQDHPRPRRSGSQWTRCWSKPDSNSTSHPLTRSPQLGWSWCVWQRRDRTDAAIAKPETPFVRVDELGGQFPGMPGAPSHGQNRLRARDRLRRLRASGGALFAFSATRSVGTIAFVVKANAKKWPRADSLMREKISLIARFNSVQGPKKFPVRMRRELAHKALS
jgi:hypothetical protein